MGSCVRIGFAVLLIALPAVAQKKSRKVGRPNSDALVECSVTAEQLDKLNDVESEFVLVNGKRIADVTLVKCVRGRRKNTVRTVIYRKAKSKTASRLRASSLARIIVANRSYDVVFVEALKARVLVDVVEKNKVVAARLKSKRHRLWPKLTAEQQAAVVKEHKEFLETVHEAFPSLPLKLYETKFFLFYTDMPQAHIAGYIAQLDSMNVELGKQFGIPAGENIWRGKAVFLAFVNRESFIQFESQFMKIDGAAARQMQGLCHQSSNGDVVVACFRGDDPRVFAQMLVHETTHGYLHRFKSSARIPSWLNEGIADWVAAIVVRSSRIPQKRQRDAALRLKRTGVIGPTFFSKKIEPWHYGVASGITNSLIKENPRAFRSWVVSIKEGVDWAEGLQKTFGVTPPQLLQAYGRSIGVPMIRLQ